jgi:hypothetical protein
MDEKKQSYTLKWTQPYTEWELMNEAITEMKVEESDLAEANRVIDYIKGLK